MPTRIGISLGIVALTLAVFLQVGGFDFVTLDDSAYVYENPHAQQALGADSVRWAFTTLYLANYIPVTWLSYFADYQRAGLESGAYHATNLALHTATAVILFVTLSWLTRRTWPSALVAALFAIHPLHVESVAWVSERKDVLSGFFWVVTLAAYGWYARGPSIARYTLVGAGLLLSLLSKPMAVTLPFVLLLFDFWPLQRAGLSRTDARMWGRLMVEKLPLFALAAVFSAIAVVAQAGSGAVPGPAVLSIGERLSNAVVSYVRYLVLAVWPVNLIPFYPYPKGGFPGGVVALAAVFLVAVTGAAWMLRRRFPPLLVGWLWYVGTLIPVIGLVQVGGQAMADRYTYMPLIGIFVIVAWGLTEITRDAPALRWPVSAVAVVAVGVLAVMGHRQAAHWRDTGALFGYTLRVDTDNPVALAALGRMHLEEKQFADAAELLERAKGADPANLAVRRNLAVAYRKLGETSKAERVLRAALRLDPNDARAHTLLGLVLLDAGKTDAARDELETAIALDPEFLDARVNYGNLLLRDGNREGAIEAYRFVLDRDPQQVEALNNLGAALLLEGDAEAAAGYFRRALAVRPDDAETHTNLAAALFALDDGDAARREVAAALALDPENAKALALRDRLDPGHADTERENG